MFPWGTLADALAPQWTRERCEQLETEGYVVLEEHPLPEEMARAFLGEVRHVFETVEGTSTPNQVELQTSSGALRLTKPHIYECDLHEPHTRAALPLFSDLFDAQLGALVEVLRDRVDVCADVRAFDTAAEAARAVTVKLQRNEGGAFPWHYDNPGRPNKRRLTMAVYLTEGWQEADGGRLELWPFLGSRVSIAPRFNTVVFFRSDLLLHRVGPTRRCPERPRYCFTVWFDGGLTNSDADVCLRADHLREGCIPFLRRSPLQRLFARAVYAEAFAAALQDCFAASPEALRVGLAEHQRQVERLLADDKVRDFVQLLRRYRDAVEENKEPSSLH